MIRTFGLRIDFSDILETPLYFVLPLWCVKSPKILLDLVYLKKDSTDASVYQQLFMEIRDRYRDHIPVYTDGSRDGNDVACATVFTAEVWAIIKALEQIKDSIASKIYIVISTRLHYSASIFTAEVWANIKAHFRVSKLYNKLYEGRISLDWDGDAKVCIF